VSAKMAHGDFILGIDGIVFDTVDTESIIHRWKWFDSKNQVINIILFRNSEGSANSFNLISHKRNSYRSICYGFYVWYAQASVAQHASHTNLQQKETYQVPPIS
jgi:hypothetical protein